MFYELSIQYDDPSTYQLINPKLRENFRKFTVNHAYPGFLPRTSTSAGAGTIINNTPGSNLNEEEWRFQYRKYLHFCQIYLNSYLPNNHINESQPPENSNLIVSSILKILSHFIPQNNWTINGENPPNPSDFFYRHFPKKSPDFDNDYHTRDPGIFWGWFHLSRWLPNLLQMVIFPFDGIIYDNKIDKSFNEIAQNNENSKSVNFGRKLTGKNLPTKLECDICERFQGKIIWDANSQWFCIYDHKSDVLDDKKQLHFTSYNDLIEWKTQFAQKLIQLEMQAYNSKDLIELEKIESKIYDLKSIFKQSGQIKNDYIVSVKG